MDRAKEIKQGLYRAAQRIGVSMATEIVKEKDGTFTVVYKAVNKEHARRWVLQKYGNDPAKWPYDPRGNGKQ